MDLSSFSKEELTFIEKLIEISNSIHHIYEELYYLDINNKKNSKEYNILLKKLKEKIKIENDIYNNYKLTNQQRFKIIELLSGTKRISKTDNITSIINQEDLNQSIRRIINNLINQTVTTINHEKISPEIITEKEKISRKINNQAKIELAINNDIILIFISILKETSSLFKYSNYTKELTKALYSTIFINKNIEEIIVKNDFNLPKEIYIYSKFLNDLLKINSKTYNKIINIIIETQLRNHIIKQLEVNDKIYDKPNIQISSIIRECYIRTLLTFLTEDKFNQLQEEIKQLINHPTYYAYYKNNKRSENVIMNCFKNIKYDKSKRKIISLNLNYSP